jgi:hypothetical protein
VVATLADRAIAAIAPLEALNAKLTELAPVGRAVERIHAAADQYNAVWDIVSDLSRFATYTSLIQGFLFSANLVRAGNISASYDNMVALLRARLVVTSDL